MSTRRRVALLALAITLTACGGGEEGASSPSLTASTSPAATAVSPLTSTVPSSLLPDVVGRELPDGEDELEAAGFDDVTAVDDSEDARTIIIRSNWTVVRMEPAGGTAVGADTPVMLYVLKNGEADVTSSASPSAIPTANTTVQPLAPARTDVPTPRRTTTPPTATAPRPAATRAPTRAPVPRKTTRPPAPAPAPIDYGTCADAIDAGGGNYRQGIDPEYNFYRDTDADGIVCETG